MLIRTLVLAVSLVAVAAPAALAQTAEPCRLAEQPGKAEPGKQAPVYHSPMRQTCEDELSKDHDWWFNLQGRLRQNIHRQAAKEITTNNRHVVLAYGAFWLLTVGFVVYLWRRQQVLKGEIARLEQELSRALKSEGAS